MGVSLSAGGTSLAAPPPAAPAVPTPEQVAALTELEKEASTYEKAARDYRGVLTGIVKHHYEDRRRRVLAALDAEIAVEKKGLRAAREDAIKKLEAFVAAHSGADAHPEKTPDAMFRLAALYEERARTDLDTSDDMAAGLQPAVALYRRIIREFPRYRELAGVYYYLGHAYNDSNRVAEAQQVFRSLVCHDRYAYPTAADPRDPTRDAVAALPQDHDRAYWKAWAARRAPGKGRARGPAAPAADEATFQNPYPDDCQPIPQATPAGQEPRYLAEAWWLIGDHHFSEADPAGGPFNLNRAAAAYQRSLRFKKPPVHGVAMYKLAWTRFKQQRYEAAVQGFVDLLRYTDEQEKLTGDPGADFRAEAYTYIAGSLTYLDFAGPAPDEPFATRSDVLDTETSPRAAEQKMRVAVTRVSDPRIIPQDKPWTVPIYRALAAEFKDLGQLHNMIEVDELALKKWPLHRDAPVVQDEIAEGWERIAALSREGASDRAEATARALAARTKLSAYVGATVWFDAHKDDPEALHTADRLAHTGLRRAAADHTNAGSALVEKALAMSDRTAQQALLEQALAEYRLASIAWAGIPADDDMYEPRFWLADANHLIVVIQVALDRSPSAAEIDAARRTAIAVRDSNEDDKYQEPAGYMVVDIAQQLLNERYKAFERTAGREGIERRDQVKLAGPAGSEHVVSEPFPREVAEAIAAREDYIRRVSPARDVHHYAALYAYQVAETHFLYGQFDEAQRRLTPIHEGSCGKSVHSVKAWRRRLAMAELSHDADGTRKLAQGALDKSCATNDEDRALERALALKALGAASYEDARTVFERAQKMPDGPERTAAWRKAAALYRVTLDNDPGGDAAPEAAINGAFAYKKVGDYEQAIGLFGAFIKAYGNEEKLAALEKGDPSVNPPRPADPAKYAQRVRFLEQAHGALAAAYVSLLDVHRAAESFDAVAKNPRFQPPARRDAARNAALLYADAGEKEHVTAARATFLGLAPPPEQRAEIDWLVAASALKAWDERGLDEGGNRTARLKAIEAMDGYLAAEKGEPAAAAYAVRAAYQSAKLRRAGRDPKAGEMCRTTVAAFEKLRAVAPVVEGRSKALGSPEADMAAECAYGLLDERIKAELDVSSGRPRYEGTVDKVVAAYDADLKKAEGYHQALQEIIERYGSPVWSAAARARQGALYDACRTALYLATPRIQLFTAQEKALLRRLRPIDPERADAYEQKRREDWRTARERKLAGADEVMVKRYAEAVLLGRALKVRSPAVDAAGRRLAGFTDLLGDARLRQYTQGVTDPATRQPFAYRDGFFREIRPGMELATAPEALPPPRPVAP